MDGLSIAAKFGIAVIGGLFSYISGVMGVFLLCLIVFMIADFITGIMASKYVGKKIESSIGTKGLIKKTYVLILVLCVYMFEFVIGNQLSTYDMGIAKWIEELGLTGITGSGIAFLYCIVELVSIVENGNKMGNNLPAPINHIFQQLSKFLSGDNNDKSV